MCAHTKARVHLPASTRVAAGKHQCSAGSQEEGTGRDSYSQPQGPGKTQNVPKPYVSRKEIHFMRFNLMGITQRPFTTTELLELKY